LLRKDTDDDKKQIQEKTEYNNKTMHSKCEELIQSNVKYEKSLALSEQKTTFLQRKIEELTKANDEINKKIEERVMVIKVEYQEEIQALRKKNEDEKEMNDNRYESKVKGLKEQAHTSSNKISELDKEKNTLIEKLNNTEASLAKIDRKKNNEISQMKQENSKLASSLESKTKSQSIEVDRLKKKSNDFELENADIVSSYEKDKALWNGKSQFMDQQIKNLKAENNELQSNFDVMFQRFQMSRNSDKEETIQNQNALIASIEQKYQTIIHECHDKHNHETFELNQNFSKAERENQNLQDRINVEIEAKKTLQVLYEKKMGDQEDIKKSLQYDIESTKEDADYKNAEVKEQYDREKEKLKNKMNDMEQKNRDGESRRTG